MIVHGVNISENRIAGLRTRHSVTKISLFGSILSDDFGPAGGLAHAERSFSILPR